MKKILKLLPFIILIIASILVLLWHNNLKQEETEIKRDKFKEEFESFNNEYENIEIPLNNPMYYASKDEIINTLDSTGIILFASPKDNESRKAVVELINIAKKTNVTKINYYNLLEDRQEVEQVDDEEVVVKEKSQFYEQLLERLDKEEITDPTIIYVVDGNIISIENSTNDSTKELMLKVSDSSCEKVC